MIRSSRFNKVAVVLVAVVAVLAVVGQSAEPKAVPFKISGGGTAPEGLSIGGADSPHNATGTATHLGKYSGEGIANVISFVPGSAPGHFTGEFHGSFVFVAANGDELACDYGGPGTYEVTPAGTAGDVIVRFVANFTYDPEQSTGRFSQVTGGNFVMIATTEPFPLQLDIDGFTPPFQYTWVGEGTIQFGKGK